MKTICKVSICFGLLATASSADDKEDAESSKITEFAFGGITFSGRTSQGELVFNNLFESSDPLEHFKQLYARGNNEAQMYAMLAFYHLDRNEYERIKQEYKSKDISITCMSGCLRYRKGLDELTTEIEKGDFDLYVPKKYRTEPPNEAIPD